MKYYICFSAYLEDHKIEIVPSYLVASKEPVKERAPANYTKKKVPEVTTSFHDYMVKVMYNTCLTDVYYMYNTCIMHV